MIHIRACLSVAVVLLAGVPSSRATEPPQCTLAQFEADAKAAAGACAATLSRPDLPVNERVTALDIRGRALHRLGRQDEAAEALEQAMLLAPTNAELRVQRGWIAYYKTELGKAAALAEQATILNPSSGAGYDLLGGVFITFGRFGAVKASYEKALTLEPDNPLFRYHLFDLFERVDQQRDALAQADIILKLPDAVITLPYSIDYQGVRTSFKTATRLERAHLLTKMGRFDDAQAGFDETVRDDPSALAYAMRGQFRAKREAPNEKVMADLDRAISLDATFWLTYDVLGRVDFYAKHYDDAAAAFAHLSKLKPGDGEAHWWRAMSLRDGQRLQEAEAEALATIDVEPGYIVRAKLAMLQKRGYVPPGPPQLTSRETIRDGVRACMIDPRCW